MLLAAAASARAHQAPSSAGQQAPAPQPPAQGQTAPESGAGQPAPAQPATPGTPATPPPPSRTFTAPAGLLFNAVRADRVADFEKVLGYLRAALEKTTDPTIRAQARGWKIFKAAEAGPGGTVLYVFAFDPTVPGADYGLGRILADAYPDAAQLQEIWRLYQGAVTSGGSLLNLTPVTGEPAPPAPVPAQPGAAVPPADPVTRP
jgi:hypothetical protein